MIRIVNPYENNANKHKAIVKKIDIYKNNLSAYFYKLANKGLPRAIEIETINRCNSDCSFCPVNVHDDPRELVRMSDQLFEKIVKDLANINYKGLIALFGNNDPLLDNSLVERCEYLKKSLPKAYVYIYTN